MIQTMHQLALDFLYSKLRRPGEPEDALGWYRYVRSIDMGRIFPYLIEPPRDSMAGNYYVLSVSRDDPDTAVLEQREFSTTADALRLPFVQSTGSQSAALGPIIKRSFSKEKGGGPTAKILNTTLSAFERIGEGTKPWSPYFRHAARVGGLSTLRFAGRTYRLEAEKAIRKAVELIPETRTCFLAITDELGRLPGEVPEYLLYLQEILGMEKYSTQSHEPVEDAVDAITGEITTVYPNALAGAGINITNVDRMGVFPGLKASNVWKKFSLSAESADLLYIFSYHLRHLFIGRVAGERALILPEVTMSGSARRRFMREFLDYVEQLQEKRQKGVAVSEADLGALASESHSLAGISIIWADFGQKMENIKGMILDILPSHLSELSILILDQKRVSSPVFPQCPVESCQVSLDLNGFAELLKRPGGLRSRKLNESRRLFRLKRQVAAALYHGQQLSLDMLWEEASVTAQEYLTDASLQSDTWGLLHEGAGKGGKNYLTLAGWIKQFTVFLDFFRKAGVLQQVGDRQYEPHREELRTFFESANATALLDSPERAYAFLVGALFGKLLSVQSARGVKVSANALTWLKRLQLSGKDLPELYVKIRDKLMAYGVGGSRGMAAVIEEIGYLGICLGEPKGLSTVETGYYLLLGQSLSNVLMPPSPRDADKADGEKADGGEADDDKNNEEGS